VLAEKIISLSGSTSELQIAPARDWDRSGHRFGSTEKAERELGFRATTMLEDGLRETIEWMRTNLDTIDSCIERHAHRLDAPVPV
jgi:UDP-glucose 4-epimerase